MEIYTDTTMVTPMPEAAATQLAPTMTIPATPAGSVVIAGRGRVLGLGATLRGIAACADAHTGSRPVFSSTTDLGSTAWGPPT